MCGHGGRVQDAQQVAAGAESVDLVILRAPICFQSFVSQVYHTHVSTN